MPARVEYRLGSIFDEECDILVIPVSAAGTVKGPIRDALKELGLPSPRPTEWGTVRLEASTHPRFRIVAFASAVGRDGSSSEVVEAIGRQLGMLAQTQGRLIAAPLVGTGAGRLDPRASAKSLEYGFLATAPDDARLVVSALNERVLSSAGRRAGRAIVRTGGGGAPVADAAPPPAEPPPPVPSAPTCVRSRVFVSYSHADVKWLQRLQQHLRPIEREGALVWDDTRLKPGAPWREEIRQALAETKVAVLLVSAAFMASDFINTDELPPLLKAAEEDGATILPVIISASRFDRTPSLLRFQAVNNPQKPLAKLPPAAREEVLDKVARAVEDALTRQPAR